MKWASRPSHECRVSLEYKEREAHQFDLKAMRRSQESNGFRATFFYIYLGHIKQIDSFPRNWISIDFVLMLRSKERTTIYRIAFSFPFPSISKQPHFFPKTHPPVLPLHVLSFHARISLQLSNNTMIELSHRNRIDMEWGEAVMGCWIIRVHTWHVECDRFYNKLAVCCDSGSSCCLLFSSEYGSQLCYKWGQGCSKCFSLEMKIEL